MGDFQGEKKVKNWQIFSQLIKNAEKIIILDAFTTQKTLDVITAVRGGADDCSIVVLQRATEPVSREVIYEKSFEKMIHSIVERLKAGKRVFVYYPPKFKPHSMEALSTIICELSGKTCQYFHADVDEATKRGLRDVNSAWASHDCVIVNSCVTCGVNYDRRDITFDVAYLFCCSYSFPREVTQVSYRPRTLNSNKIYVHFMGTQVGKNVWPNDTVAMNCAVYTQLYHSNLKELFSPNRRTLAFFFQKAGYTQTTDHEHFAASEAAEMRRLLEEHKTCFVYAGLEDITSEQAEEIVKSTFSATATMRDKHLASRHFFQKNFRAQRRSDPIVEQLWNDQQLKFVATVIKTRQEGASNIYNQIAEHNGFVGFPEDLYKVKLSKDLLDRIFGTHDTTQLFDFHSRFNRLSKPSLLLFHIYNEGFGVIYKHGKKNSSETHSVAVLEPDANDWREFVLAASLKLTTKCNCLYPNIRTMGLYLGMCTHCSGCLTVV